MRRVTLTLAEIALVLSLLVSCSRDRNDSNPSSSELLTPPETEAVENSGRTLTGTFGIRVIEDPYRANGLRNEVQITYSFNSEGGFKRERLHRGRPTSTETGSYLIGTGNQLMLYVERVNGEALGTARLEKFVIENETEKSLNLRDGGARRLTLERSQ